MESMMSQLMATLSGVNFVLHSAGILESYMMASYEKFVIDDEICGMCKRIKRGEEISAEKLALEVIRQVGPGGEYLTRMHTFQNFRKEFYAPIMEERENFANWRKKGGLTLEQRANRKWKEILAAYEEPALPGETDKALRRYIDTL
jgi:trimethylamine--corrinoid protein Co-methyltransferase